MTDNNFVKGATIIWGAFIMGQVIFAAVATFLHSTGSFNGIVDKDFEDILSYVVAGLAVMAIGASYYLYPRLLEQAKNASTLFDKVSGYRGAFILRMALHEGPSLFSLTAYLLTSNYIFLLVSVAIIALQVMIRPTVEKAVEELELSGEEKSAFVKVNENLF